MIEIHHLYPNLAAMWKNYLKTAYRNLLRNRLFSAINIGGLSLGLACCILILLYTKDELSFDRFHENATSLYQIGVTFHNENESNTMGSTNAVHGPTFKEEIPEIEQIVRTQDNVFVGTIEGNPVSQGVLFVDDDFLDLFSFNLLKGNPQTVLQNPQGAVLTENTAEKYFGKDDPLGKILELNMGEEKIPFLVTGLVQDPPVNSSLQFEILIPFSFQEKRGWLNQEWLGFYMSTYVLLHEGSSPTSVGEKMDEIFDSHVAAELERSPGFNSKVDFFLEPFTAVHLNPDFAQSRNGMSKGSNPTYSYILSGIALFILLIACINFVNLTVAKSLRRAKEIGIRKVTGGKRKQLIAQFLTESYFLTALAFAIGFIIAQIALPVFNELAGKELSLGYLLDPSLLGAFIVLFIATGFLAGFYPALVLSGFSPVTTIFNRVTLNQRNYFTKGLVVLQFVLAVSLLVGTFVVYAQFDFLTQKDLGYNDQDLMVFSAVPRGSRENKIQVIKEEISKLSGVQSVSAYNGNYNGTVAKIQGRDISFGYLGVDDDFLSTLEITLAEGRNFSKEFPADPIESILVNEAFVKSAGWDSAVGQEVDFVWKNKVMKVIGVVKDYHFASLKEEIAPLVMTQDPKYGLRSLFVKLDPQAGPEKIQEIKAIFSAQVPYMPFDYSFEQANNLKKYENEARWKSIITMASALSIIVAVIGLFGLSSYNAESRVKEIGIRKTLGASELEITRLLTGEFALLVVLGIVLAIPISYWAAEKWMSGFAYQVGLQAWTFGIAGFMAFLIAMATVGGRAYLSSRSDPSKSLRAD